MPGIPGPSMMIVSWPTAARISRIDGTAAAIMAVMMAWATRTGFDLLVDVPRQSAGHNRGHRPAGIAGFTTMPPVPAGPVGQTLPPPDSPGSGPGTVNSWFPLHPEILPCCSPIVPAIPLGFAADTPSIDIHEGTLVTQCHGPDGVTGVAAVELVARAVAASGHTPPLAAHVVPGDRVVIAIAGDIPQADAVRKALVACLEQAGVGADDVTLLRADPLTGGSAPEGVAPGVLRFAPALEAGTAYLAADAAARPRYLARPLVDADVVVTVGRFGWDATLAGRSLEGELWPAFGRQADREALAVDLLRHGRKALVDWRSGLHDITWQLGVIAGLRLVPGRAGSLHAACFGLPEEAARDARAAAEGWRPQVAEPADVAIATLSTGGTRFGDLVRGVAAASRVTQPDATICLVGDVAELPGPVLARWRQGTPLEPLLREAAESGDPALVADALDARFLYRGLGERRLVLLTRLEEEAVEDLGFGHAAEAAVIERLANRGESVAILHEADLMLPRL
jgi:hypothetical protein